MIDKDSELHSCLPEDVLLDFITPKIVTASCDKLDFKVNFEYRYQNGVTVCIEEITTEEAFRRENHQ